MKKTFTDEELEELKKAGEEEPEEQPQIENETRKRSAGEVDDGASSDEELPEVFTMTEGKSMAHQLRSEERASERKIAAEAKKKKQERASIRKGDKASEKPLKEPKVGDDNMDSAQKNGLLDDSIVQFLSARERAEINQKMVSSPPKKPSKVKWSKSKKELSNGRVQVIDLSQDTSFVEERSALEFKYGHLYGSRIKRDASMLKSLARAT